MSSDIFLSYQLADAEVAERIAERLKRRGLAVFLDKKSLVAGEDLEDVISRELREAKAALVLLSKHSRRSKWVETELQDALADNAHVVSVLLDEAAKENWVWPLLANWRAIVKTPDEDLDELAEQASSAVTPMINGSGEPA